MAGGSRRHNRNGGKDSNSYRSRGRGRPSRGQVAPQARIDPFAGPRVIKPDPPASLPSKSVAVVWLRNDLRIRDHAALALANTASVIVPVYVFDTSKFGMKNASPWGFQRNGPFRTSFLIESVRDLQNSLRIHGSDIIIRQGKPVEEILDIVKALAEEDMGPISVISHKEKTWEEVKDEKALQKGLEQLSEVCSKELNAYYVWGATMHHLDDLPFNAGGPGVPSTFTEYRKLIEGPRGAEVRPEIEMPDRFNIFPLHLRLRSDPFPSLRNDLKVEGLCDPHDHAYPDPRGVLDFEGGQTTGEQRIQDYIWKTRSLQVYKETRNESGKRNCSSKFSPWLALGCISPRTIYWECKKFEEKVLANESTYWMIFELMTRDYFHWVATSVGSKLFAWNGYSGRGANEGNIWNIDPSSVTQVHRDRLEKWIQGKTGAPIVDAHMREIAATGYMSNRGRQNVASFLIHDLQFPDWRAGAEYFESVLIDHDVSVNWANWAYLAGVGSDPRGGRKFNVIKQSMQYDESGWYLTRWCPELQEIPPPMIHEPHVLSNYELEDFGIERGVTYPNPIVKLARAPPVRK